MVNNKGLGGSTGHQVMLGGLPAVEAVDQNTRPRLPQGTCR